MRPFLLSAAFAVTSQAAFADAPRVVTDIAPVHALVTQVMGDRGTPVLLLSAGGDAHNFQLRPSQAQALVDAGLIVWVGEALSPWLERAVDGVGATGTQLELLEAAGTLTRNFGDTATDHDHGAEAKDAHAGHDHAAAAKDDHENHDHTGLDPHAWLDPENGRVWLGLIAEALASADPEGAGIYRANAVAARATIDTAEAEAHALLAPVKDKPFAVFHDAYGYFVDHFGLTVAGAIRMGDAAQPGAGHLQSLEDSLKTSGAVCVFPEANHDAAMATQLAEASGVRLGAVLDPAGATVAPGADAYAVILTQMAGTIAECLARR
jgi:zinc transport system substrate-binding protein